MRREGFVERAVSKKGRKEGGIKVVRYKHHEIDRKRRGERERE